MLPFPGHTLHKPEIIMDYNKYKGGVDTMDKMLTEYSTKRRTLRWPLAFFFFNILDISALASYIITSMNMESSATYKKTSGDRRKYLQELSIALVMPQVIERAENVNVWKTNFSTKNGLESMLGHKLETFEAAEPFQASKRDASGRVKELGKCEYCKGKRRSARKQCFACCKLICAAHSSDHFSCCTTCKPKM